MSIQRNILEQLITGSAEPVVVAQISIPDWPVVLCNPAFESIVGTKEVCKKPFADVVEQLVGRELALEISETIRAGHETTIPLEVGKREYLLVLKPLHRRPGSTAGTTQGQAANSRSLTRRSGNRAPERQGIQERSRPRLGGCQTRTLEPGIGLVLAR
jgi:PAS domain-containing protein